MKAPQRPFPSRFRSIVEYEAARQEYEDQIAQAEEKRAYQRRKEQLKHLAGRKTEASEDSLDE